jgi:succinyl-diaminopimelate desuccinylase
MKGGITAAVDTIKEIAKNHPDINGKVIFAATAGEETTSCGAKRFMEKTGKKIKPAGIIIPEPTDFEAITAHRGILWVKIKTKGKTAHGSMPHLGINAVSSMNKVINKLNGFVPKFTKHPDLGDCSLSINTITGGEAINVVPDGCTIGIDIRTLPTQNHKNIMSELEDIINSIKKEDAVFQAETSIEREVPGFQTDVNSNFIRNFCKIMNIEKTKAVGFTTDAPFFADKDTPAVIFGAGNPELCHKPDEYIEFADIKKCSRMYKNFVLDFLG